MATVSELRGTLSHPFRYLVPSWLPDHHLDGQTVLPAVEIMLLLASAADALVPDFQFSHFAQARFLRLLPIEPKTLELDVQVELSQEGNDLMAKLSRRVKTKNMTRTLRYAELVLCASAGKFVPDSSPSLPDCEKKTLTAEKIYKELVPFGPMFQTLQANLWLTKDMAGGPLRAPERGGEGIFFPLLGSPFPLDGAMHAACVHGQHYASFVPFPVSFIKRVVHAPTVDGQCYEVVAKLVRQDAQALFYDIWVIGEDGLIREEICGLEMRDVTAGNLQSPAWLDRNF